MRKYIHNIYSLILFFVFHQLIQNYNEFLNSKIENSTYVVLLIIGLVIATGMFTPQKEALASYSQANVAGLSEDVMSDTTVMINGVEYLVHFEKIK